MPTPEKLIGQKPDPAPGKKPKQKPKKTPKPTPIKSELSNELKILFAEVQTKLSSESDINEYDFLQKTNKTNTNKGYINPEKNNEKDIIVGNVSVSFLYELMQMLSTKTAESLINEMIEKCFYFKYNSYSIISFLIHYISFYPKNEDNRTNMNRDKAFETLKMIVPYIKKYKEKKSIIKFKNTDKIIPVWDNEKFDTHLDFLKTQLTMSGRDDEVDKTMIKLIFYVCGVFNIRITRRKISIDKKKQMTIEEFMTNCNNVDNCSNAIKTFMEAPNGPGAPTTQQSKGQGAPQQPQQSTGQETPNGPQQSKGQGASTSQGAPKGQGTSKSDLSNIILRF